MIFLVKRLVTIILFFSCAKSFSQSFSKGKVVNENGVPLEETIIVNANNQIAATSNKDGIFNVEKEGMYTFQKKGYLTKQVLLKKNQFMVVQLSINYQELDEVIISAKHLPQKFKKATAAISLISNKDIQRSNNTDFAPVLNRTTGVFMQSGALNTNRITIRGIGSRNLFGTAKIRAYFKDIPLTNGSGETTIEDFELASVANIEIIKGAASSAYGAGLGGVIHINPQQVSFNEFSIQPEFSVGSFGLNKSVVTANYGQENSAFKAVYSNTFADGYRDNNTYDRKTFTLHSNHFFDENNELTVLASYVDLKAFIPSSINEETFINNPESAAFTWQRAKGFEDSRRFILGVSWNHKYNNAISQVTSIFGSFRENYEPRPFNILNEESFAFGIRSLLLGKHKVFDKPLQWTVGLELFDENYTHNTFENLYRDFPEEVGSVSGELLSDFKEKRNYYNVFAEVNYDFSKKTTVSIGLNVNRTWYDLNDRFTVSETNPDQSGSFYFDNIISPKIGLSHLLSKNISLFSSISHGFSPISLEETLLPNGQINTNLAPETGWNFEIGTRGYFLENKLLFNFSLYRLAVKNLLVSRRTNFDEFIGVNAGSTHHDGLEAEVNYNWITTDKITISSFTNFSLNNYIFKEFIDDDNDFSGNELTGVPSSVFNAGLDFNFAFGFYGNLNYQYVGSMPITDANNLYSEDYQLTNFKIGYIFAPLKALTVNAFLGVNNLFNEVYASQILINASGFGGNAPRYYYPGNPVNYFSGININYVF